MKIVYQVENSYGSIETFESMQEALNFELLMQVVKRDDCPYISITDLPRLARSLTAQLIDNQKQTLDKLAQEGQESYEIIRVSEGQQQQTESFDSIVRPSEDRQDAASGHCGQDSGT